MGAYVVQVNYCELDDHELNRLCCERLGLQLRPHLWEHGSHWQDVAWFKGETLLGKPNFLLQDPLPLLMLQHLEQQHLQEKYAQVLYKVIGGLHLPQWLSFYRVAHATPRERLEAFLHVTDPT